jgi:hypothetical protein
MIAKHTTAALLLTLLLALSAGGVPADLPAGQLGPGAEEAALGGGCGERWGLFGALVLGAVTPCGVICGVAAWYMLPTLENC